MIIIFELTGDYRIILPLMFAIVLATGISRRLSRDTIYTLKLRRRGIDLMRGRGVNLMQLVQVSDAMQPPPAALAGETPLNEAIARLADAPTDGLPVVDENGAYRGIITSQQIEQAMRDNALDATAGELAQEVAPLTTGETLEDALGALVRARSGLPVVAADRSVPVGWLTHVDVLRAYNTRLEQGIRQAREPTARLGSPREPRRVSGMLARLRGYRIVELELATGQPPVGRRLNELDWPGRTVVLAIRRDQQVFEPVGDERLERGDRLTVLVPAAAADELVDTISPPSAAGPEQRSDA